MKKILSLLFISSLILAGCGSSDKKEENKTNEKEKKMSKDEINDELFDINEWLTGDYWNDALVDISYFLRDGTSATGQKMDSAVTLKNYNRAYEKAVKQDKFIQALTGKEYTTLIESWNRLYAEMQKIDDYIQVNPIMEKADPEFSTDIFVQYQDDFTNEVELLKEK